MMRPVLAAACAALIVAHAPARAAEPAATTATTAPVDAARLAAARQTVDYVFPAGTYARLMNGTMDQVMDTVMDSTMRLPLKDLAGIAGVDTEKLGSASLAEIMEIYDPAYKERMRISTRTMMNEMMGLMTQFEPDIRDGLAGAYASRFDARQLGELNSFFATPTGKAYAADSYLIMMSPEVMTRMQAFMPKMMQQMPAIVEKVKTATATFPAPRQYADLSETDKTKLAKILGVARKDLDKSEAAKDRGQ
ncbi:DUF2059 domain-containing protein [Novosphingobium sp. BL-52-GroH]|uniref:DUF2059 domain-containing protein n=1 Tax=Novosphingobium sp. BL-52-GroH TaxID=3349877 RepID=UPI00384F6432